MSTCKATIHAASEPTPVINQFSIWLFSVLHYCTFAFSHLCILHFCSFTPFFCILFPNQTISNLIVHHFAFSNAFCTLYILLQMENDDRNLLGRRRSCNENFPKWSKMSLSMKLQSPPNLDSISCGSFVGCKELTEMMHPATHQRRRGERIRGTEGDANAWIEWVCAWVLWCGSRTVRWCRWMRNHRQPLLHQENILLGCTHSARAGCKVNCALEAVQCFNSSAKFQQQCNVSTAVWGGSECGIRQHSRQIIHQWIIPAKHYSGDFNSSPFSYDLLFDKSVLIIFILK